MRSQKPSPLVLVQTIVVIWSTSARGGKNAAQRNHVPEALEFPAQEPKSDQLSVDQRTPILYHHPTYSEYVKYREPSNFERPVFEGWKSLPSHLPESTAIALEGGLYGYRRRSKYVEEPPPPRNTLSGDQAIHVTFDWKGIVWAPIRPSKLDRFDLTPGQWAQIRLNGRTGVLEGGWEYYKYVLNIGYASSFTRTFFLDSPPTRSISDMADLW